MEQQATRFCTSPRFSGEREGPAAKPWEGEGHLHRAGSPCQTAAMSDKPTMFGKIKDKLIASKQQWARDGRLLTGHSAPPSQRLPPGQRLTESWPVLDLGVQPDIPKVSWRLDVDGLEERSVCRLAPGCRPARGCR